RITRSSGARLAGSSPTFARASGAASRVHHRQPVFAPSATTDRRWPLPRARSIPAREGGEHATFRSRSPDARDWGRAGDRGFRRRSVEPTVFSLSDPEGRVMRSKWLGIAAAAALVIGASAGRALAIPFFQVQPGLQTA